MSYPCLVHAGRLVILLLRITSFLDKALTCRNGQGAMSRWAIRRRLHVLSQRSIAAMPMHRLGHGHEVLWRNALYDAIGGAEHVATARG